MFGFILGSDDFRGPASQVPGFVSPSVDQMSAAAEFPWRLSPGDSDFCPLFANAPLCFAQVDPRATLVALNPALRRILGSSVGSCRLNDLIDPALRSECDRLMQEMFAGIREGFQLESSYRIHGFAAVRWTVWRVSERNKSAYGLVLAEELKGRSEQGSLQEKREQERPEEDGAADDQRLRHAMRLQSIGRLAAGVVHDFNNLLTGMLLYCDLLLGSLQSQEARKYAEEIRNAGLQAAGVVRQLLSVARPANARPRLLSLNEVIEALCEFLSRLIGDNIRLHLRLDPRLGMVRLDYTQAQQILLNLVLNARDAMPDGGEIAIETSNCSLQILNEPPLPCAPSARLPCVLLLVSDNGSGIDDATRAHLFEAFFTTKGSKGTGLGLAGVYDIVTANGGLIHVDSAPGDGTRVNVLLPLSDSNCNFESMQPPKTDPDKIPMTEEA